MRTSATMTGGVETSSDSELAQVLAVLPVDERRRIEFIIDYDDSHSGVREVMAA